MAILFINSFIAYVYNNSLVSHDVGHLLVRLVRQIYVFFIFNAIFMYICSLVSNDVYILVLP